PRKALAPAAPPPASALAARAGEAERVRVAARREPLQRRAAGIAQPQHARALVKGLARRVVERAPHDVEAVEAAHVREQRVPAACDQAQEWGLEALVAVPGRTQEVGGHVA